jgi:hypothetical protein
MAILRGGMSHDDALMSRADALMRRMRREIFPLLL